MGFIHFFGFFYWGIAFLVFLLCLIAILAVFCDSKLKEQVGQFQTDNPWLFPLSVYFFFGIFSLALLYTFIPIPKLISHDSLFSSFITVIGANILLIITLTFVIIQLHAQSYGFRINECLKVFYDFWLLIAIETIFLLGVICCNKNVFLILFFGFTSIILIIPYFYNILVYLRPENLINRLMKIIAKKGENGRILQNNTQAIFDIIINAITHGDIATANDGMGKLIGSKMDDGLEEARVIIRSHYRDPENDSQSVKGIVKRSTNYIEFLLIKDSINDKYHELIIKTYQYSPTELRRSISKNED